MPSGRVKKGATLVKQSEKPQPPGYLDNVARAEYKALVEVLANSGKLTTCDPKLVELYAVNYSILMRAVETLNTQPLAYGEPGKRPFVNPLIAVVHNATQKIRQVINDFALSPVTAKMVEQNMVEIGGKWQDLLD